MSPTIEYPEDFEDEYEPRPGDSWGLPTAAPAITRQEAIERNDEALRRINEQLDEHASSAAALDWAAEPSVEPGKKKAPRGRLWAIAATIAATALIVLLFWALNRPRPVPPAPTITEANPSTSATTTETVVPTEAGPIPTGVPVTGRADQVATSFAADYANTDGGKDEWFNRISRWTSPQLTDGYRVTDPNRLPVMKFQHLSQPLNNDSGTVLYDATYDSATLEIRVAYREDSWQVVAVLQAAGTATQQTGDDPEAPVTTPFIPTDITTVPALPSPEQPSKSPVQEGIPTP
ncbi:hypothetical protein [Mycobacteroides abscessus]|uniref:hypothetical protein n=1 Tax=Mycobacteroides abscessus TaxID=36809 RepID=UPI0009A68451|nr:hypothetical protein [Mycobacteroides abscessus]SKK36047.1 Uncharacterised protein [Mycobacteroides abscessus subsp. abscessus]